jgi:hypothetical protein
VIKDVENWFAKEISKLVKNDRNWFDTKMKHSYIIKQSVIMRILYPDLSRVVAGYNQQVKEHNAKEEKRLEAAEMAGTGGDTFPDYELYFGHPSDPSWIEKDPVVEAALRDTLLNENFIKKHFKRADSQVYKKFNTKNPKWIRNLNVYSVKVTFEAGEIATKRKNKKGARYGRVLNFAMIRAYEDAFAVIRDAMANQVGKPFYMVNAEGKKEATRIDGRAVRRGTATKQITSGHQATRKSGGGEIKAKGLQKTVARMTLAKRSKEIFRKTVKSPTGKNLIGPAFDEIKEEMHNALEIEYQLSELRDINSEVFDLSQVVNIEATDPSGNKGIIDHYDVGGIRDFLATKANAMAPKLAEKYGKDVAEMQGSGKTKDVITAQMNGMLIAKLLGLKHMNKPNMRLKVNKQLLAQAKKAKVKKRRKTGTFGAGLARSVALSSKGGKASKGTAKKVNATKGKSVTRAKTAQSPIALRNLLNEMLPQMVASKMTSPALRFRTGRFANSARVENVNVGPRGGIDVDYTYMRDPYETFEPGGKQGSTQRDPRKIIGASIRELAMGILGRQPTTIRRQ